MFRPLIPSPLPRHAGAAVCIALAATCLSAQPALASANVEGLLQNVVDMLTGNTARLLAVLAVVVVGILWMFGLGELRMRRCRRSLAATALPIHLDRRTRHVGIGAEYAAVARQWLQRHAAPEAIVKPDASVGGHGLRRDMTAMRAGQRRLQNEGGRHRIAASRGMAQGSM